MWNIFQGFRSSPSSSSLAAAAALDSVRQVEAKYPALLFKQQLTAEVEKMYGIIRDNLKRELSSLISLCIQVFSKTSLSTSIVQHHSSIVILLYLKFSFVLLPIISKRFVIVRNQIYHFVPQKICESKSSGGSHNPT
ncbi:hypothetical protein SOVF_168620 [Spinacia oleracea]|nr:hypothetical protein SOVF_168620 [Spinacia oleracea]